MKVNISEMLETLKECYDEMKGDVESTNDLIIDDFLISLGYNKKRNKNIRRTRNKKVDWEIVTESGSRIAIKVYAIGNTIDDKSKLETIEAGEKAKYDVIIITNGEFIDVSRYVEAKSSFEEIANIHITDELTDSDINVLSAISKDGFDLKVLDSMLSVIDLTPENLYDIIKSNEDGLKKVVCEWANIKDDSDKKFVVLWGNFFKDFVKKISVSGDNENSIKAELNSKIERITELEEQLEKVKTQLTLKDDEIEALRREIDESTVSVHKRAVEMLDLIASSNDGTRNYVALINDEIIQYDTLHKFVGRVLQQLYKIKSFEAQPFIFNGNIFRLISKNVKYNDLIVNNKAYDIDINDIDEDDAILKLKTLFSKFSDIVFECKKLGIKDFKKTPEYHDESFDHAEVLLTDEVEAADKFTATSGTKIGQRTPTTTNGSGKEIHKDSEDDKLSKSDNTSHESGSIENKTENSETDSEEIRMQVSKLSSPNDTADTNNDASKATVELSKSENSEKISDSDDQGSHITSEGSQQLTKNGEQMGEIQYANRNSDEELSSDDSSEKTNDSEGDAELINKNENKTSDSENSKNKDENNCDTEGDEDSKKNEEQSENPSDTYNEESKTNDTDIADDIDLGFSEFENITDGIDDTSGEDVVAEKHEEIQEQLAEAEEELEESESDSEEEDLFDFDDELDDELSDSELDRFMNTDEETDFDPFHIIDNEPNPAEYNEEDAYSNESDEDDIDEDELYEEDEDELDEEDEDTDELEDVAFGDIGTDLSGKADIQTDTKDEQNTGLAELEDKKAKTVSEIIEQKLNDARVKEEENTDAEEVILNQFEPEMDDEEESEELEEDIETSDEVESTPVEDEVVTKKQEAIISEIASGTSINDETDEYEAYFAGQPGLDIQLGREDDDEEDDDDTTVEKVEETKSEDSQSTESKPVDAPKVEKETDDTDDTQQSAEESQEEEYDDLLLLVSQMQNVDKLMFTDDNVTFFNVKYIGSNDVTYLVNSGEDDTMTYEKLLCKCIQAVVAIQEYNGDKDIIARLKQKDLTGINEHIKHKSAEFRDYPALKVAPFVVAGITNLKDVALAVLDFCKGMEIDMSELFMYIEATTDSEYIIENYGYDEDSVQLRDTDMYVPADPHNIKESLAYLDGSMFNKVIVSENSLRVHKDVILGTLAIKTKYLQKSISDPSEFASIVEEMIEWAAANNMDINLNKIGPVLGKNYKIMAVNSDDVGPDHTQIEVKGRTIYVTNVENWQIPTSLIKIHTAITGNTSIVLKVRINADAVNYYGSEYDTSEPSASLAITSYVNYVASCVKQVKR